MTQADFSKLGVDFERQLILLIQEHILSCLVKYISSHCITSLTQALAHSEYLIHLTLHDDMTGAIKT